MNAAPTFQAWQNRGQYIELLGHRLFVIDEGEHKETIAILHGYPSCSYDYYSVLPLLTKNYRVLVHDHPGFGLSSKKKAYSYSLFEQADVAQALWQYMGLKEVHLLAHDYGTSIATEIIARYNMGYEAVHLKSICLGNGSMLINMSRLLWTQKVLKNPTFGPYLAKLSTKALFVNNFKRLWHDKSKINLQEFDVLWQMLIYEGGREVLPFLSQYINERKRFWHRWIGGLEHTDKHIHLVWADKDPVAVFEMAAVLQQKIKSSSLEVLENVGHYPMLEAPERYARAVLKNLHS